MPSFKLLLWFSFVPLCLISARLNAQSKNPPAQLQIKKYDSIITGYRYSNLDSALFYIREGMAFAKVQKYRQGEAVMLNQLGMVNDNQGKYAEAKENYNEALSIYKALNELKGTATETYRLGVVESRNGNYDKAIAYHLRALELSERIHDPHGIIEANLGLTDDYLFQQKYSTAFKYIRVADATNATMPFSNLNLSIANLYGVLYREAGKYDLAKQYLEKGLSQANQPRYNGSFITLTNTLATVYTKEGNIEQAIEMQKVALEKSRAIKNYLRESESLFNLAVSYSSVDLKQSMDYLTQAKKLAQQKQVNKQVINALGKISGIYEKLGKYPAALDSKKEQYKLADKFYYQEMSKQIAGLQSGYDLNKSREELRYLNDQQQYQKRIIVVSVIVMLIVIVIISIFYYQLRKLNQSLSETNGIKDRLLSVLAHDLRSPFISIINLLQIIDDEDLGVAERKKMLAQLETGSKASLETLDSLLKWGQMQIKGVQIVPVRFEIKPVIARILQLFSETANQKKIVIKDLADAGIMATADLDHFEFVMRNLLSNAIKFTPSGGRIWIIAVANNDKKQVTITVKDNGVGMDEEKLRRIFSLDNISAAGTTNEKGTSMGLLMCKEFIEANKGTIGVVSGINEGSDFYITLPI